MGEDQEKKFHNIMNKLFQSPKSKIPISSSSSNVEKMRGQKRTFSAVNLNSRRNGGGGNPNTAQAPPCRPWDRGDLMRRVATFKSMRWFAKPKVMDAVNCARRGWVNVDMDIIACEVCGSRLQFSTPSTWSQQQVEKAALVFSVKLDSGHKLLCPWTNNACDDNLALFPPLPSPVLVDRFKERSASLLQLSALPVMSASAFESMRSPLLEHFLKQSIAVECGARSNGSSWTKYLGNEVEAVSADLYYQAHRLLSLCGWEPRLLPYVVDSVDRSKQFANDKDLSYLSHTAVSEKNNKLCVFVSGSGENGKEIEDTEAPIVRYDPNSTVLDCKLCGASIGLWAFTTVPRPLEFIRVSGYSEFDSGSNQGSETSRIGNHGNNEKTDFTTLSKEATFAKETTFNFSIAGGPPPTKQNYRTTVSLPVVGRNVRARLSCGTSEIRSNSGEGHASHNAIVEGSVEIDSSGVEKNSLMIEGESHELQQNDDQGEKSIAIADDCSNPQQRSPDNVALMKDTSSIPSVGQKENGGQALQIDVSSASTETDLRRHSSDQKMEFDPVRQHRHFCPWAASTGTSVPGWQQTLSALQKEKVFLLPEYNDFPSSPSLIKVDDPITSIRKLFESPSAKKMKPASA